MFRFLSIKNFPSLVNFLAEELQWPIDLDEFDDYESLAYDFSPEELGIKEEFISKIKNIKQLRPIGDNPYAIFWIDFESLLLDVHGNGPRHLLQFLEQNQDICLHFPQRDSCPFLR